MHKFISRSCDEYVNLTLHDDCMNQTSRIKLKTENSSVLIILFIFIHYRQYPSARRRNRIKDAKRNRKSTITVIENEAKHS